MITPPSSTFSQTAFYALDWFKKEQETVFSEGWHFACMADELHQQGDYKTIQLGVHQLIVIKKEEGFSVFHNSCLHRGTQLLADAGTLNKGIRCPYHNWFYDLDGKLLHVPHAEYFEGCPLKGAHLKKGSSATWNGLLFIHPEEVPQKAFDNWLQKLADFEYPFAVEDLYHAQTYRYHIRCNWKIFIENFIDGYHLSHLHSETLSGYDHEQQRWCFEGSHWVFEQALNERERQEMREWAKNVPLIAAPEFGVHIVLFHPHVAVMATESYWCLIQVKAIAPEKTTVDIQMRYKVPDQAASSVEVVYNGFTKEGPPKAELLASKDIMLEDIYVCEMQQRNIKSRFTQTIGFANHYEEAILTFRNMIFNTIQHQP